MSEPDPLNLAAALANPWGRPDLPMVDAARCAPVIDVLVRNKASFLDMERKFGAELARTPFKERADSERRYFDALRGEFERVRTDLAAHGVRTMLFKSTGLYPSFPHLSSNLDVLVEPGRGDLGRERLYHLGYNELLNVEEPVKFLFRRFSGDGLCYTFHLHEQVGWGIPFLSNDLIWSGARSAPDDPGITVPSPRDALQVTLAHWFYEDKTLTLENLFLTANALRELGGGIAEAASHARERGWEDGLHLALRIFDNAWRRIYGEDGVDAATRDSVERYLLDHRLDGARVLRKTVYGGSYPAEVPFFTNKVYWVKKLWRDRHRSLGRKVADFSQNAVWTVRAQAHVVTQKPLLVALSGCDGSGKTVQARRLEAAFRTCDTRVTTVWSRGASSAVTGALIRIGKRVFGASGGVAAPETAGEASKLRERRRLLDNPTARALFSVVFALELFWTYGVRVRARLWTGHVVICDRHVADAFVDFAILAGRPVGEAPAALRWLRAACPAPHAAYLLDVIETDALRRKPEEGNTDHLLEARRAFKQLAADRGIRVMDAHLSEAQVYEALAHDALSRFYLRYRTVINWLLLSNPRQMNPRAWRAVRIYPQ
jgi:thymidylate kinase